MDAALKVVKMIALLSVVFVCCAIGYEALQVRVALDGIREDVHGVASKTSVVLDDVAAKADSLSTQVDSTMASARATLKQATTTIATAGNTIAKVDPALDKLPAVIGEAYSVEYDARLSLDNVNKAAIAERLYFEKTLPGLLDAVRLDVVDAGDTLTAAKTFMADPNLKRLVADSADIVGSGKSIAGDAAYGAHRFFHPEKKHGFIAGFEATGDVMKHWIPSLF